MNVPKLRFKEFSGEWKVTKLGDVCEFTQGIQLPSSEQIDEYKEGYIRYLYIRDFFSDNMPCYVKNIYTNKIIKSNEIMIVNTGNTAGKAYMGVTGVLSNNAFKVSFNHELIDNNFIFNTLISDSTQNKIQSFFNLSGQPHLGHKNIALVPFKFPSLPEQTRIANFLTAIDEKISQLTQKHDLLKQYKKGVMQQIFSQKLRFKDEDGREFPEWEEKKLGSVANRVTRKNKENNKNVLTISAQQGLINQEEYFNKSVSAKDVTNYYLLHTGDFAYNKSYSNGYPMGAIKCLNRYEKGVVSTLYICFKFIEGNINSFFEHYFENGFHNSEIEKVAQEGARNHGLLNIGLDDFFNISLIVPSTKEQTKIANFLTAIDDKITHTQTQLDAVKQYKKGLLQQLFV